MILFLKSLTARLTLGTEGPWLRINRTISASPAQAAKWSGEDPLASTTLVEASYWSSNLTTSLDRKEQR